MASQVVDFGLKASDKSTKAFSHPLIKNPFKNFSNDYFKRILEVAKRHKIVLLAIFLIVIAAVAFVIKGVQTSPTTFVGTSKTNFSPQVSIDVNRKFEVPIRDTKGDPTGANLTIILTTMDKANRILIQGKPATARDTKAFMILNLEIENSTSDQLTIKPVDLVRLIDSEGRSFAPDVHNNEVVAEPVSVKKTRVGFVADENQNNFKFLIGEVNGEKQVVEITI